MIRMLGVLCEVESLRVTNVLLVALLALSLMGCSDQAGRDLSVPDQQPALSTPDISNGVLGGTPPTSAGSPVGPSQLSQLPPLPPPSQLPRRGSAAAGDRNLDGVEYDALLPKARIFPDAPNLNFAPAGDAMNGLAYAIYHFDLPGYGGGGSVNTSWDSPPAAESYFVGVADFSRGAWKWFNPASAETLVLPGTLEFLSPTDQVYVVVALTGTQVHLLTEINFGGDQPPVAVLRPQYYFVDADNTIEFDASASSDDVAIAKFEWDLDSDGSFELDSGLDPLVSKHYPLAADITVQLRVTDDAGQSSIVNAGLHVDSPGYDETEGNNDVSSADALPGVSFKGWDGNLGPGGYDGSAHDYYSFTVSEPMRVVFEVQENSLEVFQLDLYNSNGTNLLQAGSYMTDDVNMFYYFDTPGNFILDIECSAGISVDYSLGASVRYGNSYDEVESNNSRGEANTLDPAGLRNLWGNLGAGGYDGGTEDWYVLELDTVNIYYTFVIDHYLEDVNLDLELYDGDTLLKSSELDLNHEYLGYGFEDAGTYYLRVFVRSGQDPGASGDYLLHLTNRGEMPDVVLTATPDDGTRPLLVTFDASDSTIPEGNYVLEYNWDLNNDGYAEIVTNENEPSVSATYYAAGDYSARVVVRLATLAVGDATAEVNVDGAASEVEPNNSLAGAQALPGFPFSNFFGDVGPGGYDGGSVDFYSFTLPAGKTVAFDLDYQRAFIFVGALIYSFDNEEQVILAESYENDGNEHVSFTNTGETPRNLYFGVISDPEWFGGYGGYRFSGGIF